MTDIDSNTPEFEHGYVNPPYTVLQESFPTNGQNTQ